MNSEFESKHPRGAKSRFVRKFHAEPDGELVREPSGLVEGSRRAILNLIVAIGPQAECLTLIGGHAVHERTASLDVPIFPTSDGDSKRCWKQRDTNTGRWLGRVCGAAVHTRRMAERSSGR